MAVGTGGARLRRFLESGSLAVWLVVGVCGWVWLGSEIPQGDSTSAAVRQWAAAHLLTELIAGPIGLHHAYAHPIFIAAVLLLLLSTGLCAWRRSSAALRAWRGWGKAPASVVARLGESPTFAVAATVSGDPLSRLSDGLGRRGFTTRREGDVLVAGRGRVALLGSPVFHWALVILIAVTMVGRLTRAEGVMAVPVGASVTDERAAYASVDEAPLYPGHTGLSVGVSDLSLTYVAGGRDRGPSPLATLSDGSRTLVRQRVYPNNPLRYGGLLIHPGSYGLTAEIALVSRAGKEVARARPLADFDPAAPSGTKPVRFRLTSAAGTPTVDVTLTILAQRARGEVVGRIPSGQRIEVASASPLVPHGGGTLTPGRSIRFTDGSSLRFVGLGYFVTLSIVDDWSVYPIYVMFFVAIVGVGSSLLFPPRMVWALFVDGEDGGGTLNVLIRRNHDAAAFAARVRATAEATAREGRDI